MYKVRGWTKKNIVVLVGIIMLLVGCGAKEVPATSDEVQTSTTQKAKSVEEIYEEIKQTVALASPVLMDDEFIANYYGIDSATLEEYVFSMSEDAAQAETVIVMKAKEEADLGALSSSLQVVVDEKRNEMENYLPEQFAIVEKSEVQTKGNYVWLVISEQADAIVEIIEKNTAD